VWRLSVQKPPESTTVDPAHLRALAVTHADHVHMAAELRRAADEIERLRERLEQARFTIESLREFARPAWMRSADGK
jgi:hypothetical protein